ncbi:hypothetical protein GCM10027181_21530 [Rheinheimera gaetbuli]
MTLRLVNANATDILQGIGQHITDQFHPAQVDAGPFALTGHNITANKSQQFVICLIGENGFNLLGKNVLLLAPQAFA